MAVESKYLSDAEWIEDVTATMLAWDEGLGDEEVAQFVSDLASRPEWRSLPPDEAAARARADIEPAS